MGTSKIQADGITIVDAYDATIIKKVIARSKKVVLVAQKYKFEAQNSSPYKSADLKDIDVLITNEPLSAQYRAYFKPDLNVKYVKD